MISPFAPSNLNLTPEFIFDTKRDQETNFRSETLLANQQMDSAIKQNQCASDVYEK